MILNRNYSFWKISLLIGILFCSQNFAQSNPFSDLIYDKVIAYEYDGSGDREIQQIIAVIPERLHQDTLLDSTQVKDLEDIICDVKAYGNTTSACFDPHFAVIYYNGDSIVAQIEICLSCNYLVSFPEIPATKHFIIDKGKESERARYGFSKKTRKSLTKFILALGFTRYIE